MLVKALALFWSILQISLLFVVPFDYLTLKVLVISLATNMKTLKIANVSLVGRCVIQEHKKYRN